MKRLLPLISFFVLSLFFAAAVHAQDFIFTQVTNPAGMYYDAYIAQDDEQAYLAYRDLDYNRSLYAFDGEELTEIESPAGFMFNWYLAQLDNTLYLSFYDENYYNVLMSYEGGTFTQIQADFPDEDLGYYAFTYEDQVYITY